MGEIHEVDKLTSAPTKPRPHLDWRLLILTYLSLFIFGLADNARGPVFPDLLRDYALSDAVGAFFFMASSAAGLVNNLLAFVWLKKLGSFRALQVFSLLQGIALLGMNFAPSFGIVLILSALLGASSGGLGIAQNLLTVDAASPEKRRQALSGLHCMYGISSLIAPLMVTSLYERGGQWKQILAWISLGSFVVVALSLFGGKAAGRKNTGGGNDGAPAVKSPQDARFKAPVSGERGRLWRRTLYFGLTVSLYVIAEIALSTRLVLYARREMALPLEKANLLLSGFFLALFLGRLAFALVQVPVRNARLLVISAVASFVCFALGLIHHPGWLVLCGLAMSWFYPSAMAWINEEMGSETPFATSWCVTIQSLGLMLMHFALGALSDSFGLRAALWLGPICLASVVALLGMRRGIGSFS